MHKKVSFFSQDIMDTDRPMKPQRAEFNSLLNPKLLSIEIDDPTQSELCSELE